MITALCVLLSAALAFTPAPRDALMARLILYEVSRHGVMNRSDSPSQPGQCRRFQVDAFARVSGGFQLASYPDAQLYLPAEHAPWEETGRTVGACWQMPDPSTGNAFVQAAAFDYDRDLTQRQNEAEAQIFLRQARAGDVVQLMATYDSGGRGTHTILITRPFDPRDGMLYWADSNFANTEIDDVRYGFVRAYQQWPLSEVAAWLAQDMGNGATLYRLSWDVAWRTAETDTPSSDMHIKAE